MFFLFLLPLTFLSTRKVNVPHLLFCLLVVFVHFFLRHGAQSVQEMTHEGGLTRVHVTNLNSPATNPKIKNPKNLTLNPYIPKTTNLMTS